MDFNPVKKYIFATAFDRIGNPPWLSWESLFIYLRLTSFLQHVANNNRILIAIPVDTYFGSVLIISARLNLEGQWM